MTFSAESKLLYLKQTFAFTAMEFTFGEPDILLEGDEEDDFSDASSGMIFTLGVQYTLFYQLK